MYVRLKISCGFESCQKDFQYKYDAEVTETYSESET